MGNEVQKRRGFNSIFFLQKNFVYFLFIIIFVFFYVVVGSSFASLNNLMNIARQTAMISIMAIGMTFALSSGEIDLSIGSVLALSALITALSLENFSLPVAVIFGLGSGLLVGAFNGIIVAKVGVPSFLVTLATMGIVQGLSRWITNLKSVPIGNDTYNFIFGSGNIGIIPVLLIWTLGVLIVSFFVLKRTPFGMKILASGGNERAAYFSGINTRLMKMMALMLSSLGASLAGMLYAGRLHGARYTLGEGLELSVIAASVLGGTSLFGGKGTVIGSVIGSVMIGMINNGLILMGLSVAQQMFFRGIILLIAISINVRMQSRQ